jgi:uncharacterized caspase-like protein
MTPSNCHSTQRVSTRLVALVLVAVLAAGTMSAAAAASRSRVLIFASTYEQFTDKNLRLYNTLVDAQSISDLFKHRIGGTEVTLVENPTPSVWQHEITAFVGRLRPADTAILYYAGHAVQKDGANYFLSAEGASLALIAGDEVLSLVMAAHPRGTIFFIDACRDNPFHGEGASGSSGQVLEVHNLSRGWKPADGAPTQETKISTAALSISTGGLSQMSNVRGRNAIVFFSTDPGNVALDGAPGRGSPFANALASELTRRVSLDDALRSVTQHVASATQGRQSPWRQGDLGFPLFLAGEARIEVSPAL